MNWSWALGTAVGSVISWVAFAGCGYLWAQRKVLPFWHTHKQAILKTLYGGDHD